MASAPALAFLDSDDIYCARRLSLPLAVFEREPDVICTLSSSRKEDKRGQGRAAPLPDVKLAAPAFEWAMLADLVGVESTSITVRTEHAKIAGGFDETLRRTEDREFLIRLARLGAVRILPDVLFEKSLVGGRAVQRMGGRGTRPDPLFPRAPGISGRLPQARAVPRDQNPGHAYPPSRFCELHRRSPPLPRGGPARRRPHAALARPSRREAISSHARDGSGAGGACRPPRGLGLTLCLG